jgi:quinolinate synthase
MLLWDGTCIVHVTFDEKKIVQLKVRHPSAKVIAHPECPENILRHADHIGSTSSLLEYAKNSPAPEFIVVTESGIIHQMTKACPDKTFIPAPTDDGCSCNECPFMKLNTLEKLFLCLRDETPEIVVPEAIRLKALVPLERMLEISAR